MRSALPLSVKFGLTATALALAPALAAPVFAQTVATVNGKEIPKSRADVLVREQSQQGRQDSPQMREMVKNELINRELIAQEAERRGMTKTPDVQQQMELARQQVVLRAFLQDFARTNQVTDDAIKAEYEKAKTQMGGTEYKARHILVKTEDEAKGILTRLKKGDKFDELAKLSEDPGSKGNGGDLGWSTPATFVKPFADAMAALKKGDTVAAPVQTQFGWHVIRLDDTRTAQAPGFDQVKPQIQQRLQAQQLEKFVADLRAKAKIQ
jgi:peptidyl-prolyl cis-trans isomerase C